MQTKKIFVFSLSFIFLVCILPAFALTKDDFFGQILEKKVDLTYSYIIFEIKNPTALMFTLNTSKLTYRIAQTNRKWTNIKYFAEETILKQKNETICTQTKGEDIGNGTTPIEASCSIIQYYQEDKIWSDLSKNTITFNPFETKKIKVLVEYPAELGNKVIDWVPRLSYGANIYEKPEWEWFNTTWTYRRLINLSASNLYQEWFIDLENITSFCEQTNCSDIRITEGETKLIPYQIIVNGSTQGHLVSKWSGRNATSGRSYAYFVTQNTTNIYYIYYGATGVADSQTKLLVWEDDFESYQLGNYPQDPSFGLFRGGSPLECGTDNCRKNIVSFNSTLNRKVISNFSVIDAFGYIQFQFNMTNMTFMAQRTQTGVNTEINGRERYGILWGYSAVQRNPCTVTVSSHWCIRDNIENNFIAGPTPATQGVVTISLVFNHTTIRLYEDTTLILTGEDGTTTQGDSVYWSLKGNEMQAIDSLRIMNTTVIPYTTGTSKIGGEETVDKITITILSPTNSTFTSKQQLLFTISTVHTTIDKCWYKLDELPNISLPGCQNITLNTGHGFHTLSVGTNATNSTYWAEASVNFTYNFNFMQVFVFDETIGSGIENFTATLSNSTLVKILTANVTNVTFQNYVGSGLYTLTASATGYGTRSFSFQRIDGETLKNLYLLSSSLGHDVGIRTTTASGSPISNIQIVIQKLINATYQNVTTGYTDDTGIVSSFLDSTIAYRLIIYFPSGTRTFSFQPVSNLYVFTDFGIFGQPASIYEDISYKITPENNILEKNSSQKISIIVRSYNSSLIGGLIHVTWNGTNYYANLTGSPSIMSGTIILDLTSAAHYQTITSNFYINSTNAKIGYMLLETRKFHIVSSPIFANLTLETILKNLALSDSGINISALSIVALLIALITTGLLHSRLSLSGFSSLIIFVCVLGIFTVVGWFDSLLFILIVSVSILYYIYITGAT